MKSNEENVSDALSIEKYLGINLKMLSFIGLEFGLNGNRLIKKSLFRQKLPVFLTNALGFGLVVLQLTFITEAVTRDASVFTQVSSELFSNILCVIKGLRLATSAERLQVIFDELAYFWDTYRPSFECRENVLSVARNTLYFSRCYLAVVMINVLAFGIPPIQNYLAQYLNQDKTNHTYDYSKRVLVLTYPFEVNSVGTYFSVLFEEEYYLLMAAVYWVGCDSLFAQFTTHTSLQLEILQSDLETLINREDVEESLKKNVAIFVKRHRGLLRLCDLIEDIFSPVIFTTVMLSALNICVNMYEVRGIIAKGYTDISKTIPYAVLVMTLFFQIAFYCIFAESLTQQTSAIATSIYNCKWTIKNPKLRFYLQIIIMKSQTPFHCTAYGFFPLGHEQFKAVISTSFSYYMMLQSLS